MNSFKRFFNCLLLFVFLFFIFCNFGFAGKQKLILASTTSTYESGLFDVLLPVFEKKYNCKVKVIAVGTGQAIRIAKDGNADVILVHDRESEDKFVKDGFGVKRYDVMHNDFLIVGPKDDPAGIGKKSQDKRQSTKSTLRKRENRNQKLENIRKSFTLAKVIRQELEKESDAVEAFKKIFDSKSLFVSRGDDSGTHKKELRIWKELNIKPSGKWYIESGTGMEATLRIANEKKAYCLVDRATWLSHLKEIDSLKKFVEGDPILYNPYSVIAVSPKKYAHVNYKLATKFIEFIRSSEGQKIIREYGLKKFGEPLYFPDVIVFDKNEDKS